MTDDVAVRVEGLARLVRTMNKARRDISELKDAHKRVGDLVAREARVTAPHLSGALAGSVRAARQARRARVMVGSKAVPYAGPIHWGWPSRGIEARPFVSEAAQDTEGEWLPIYRKDIQRALDKVKGK